MDDLDLYQKAQHAGQLKYWTQVFYEIEKLEAEDGKTSNQFLKEKQLYLEKLRAKTSNAYYAMLSIRPKIDQKFEDFEPFINRVVKKCWLKDNCLWVYEQKGENEADMGKGLHCHILYQLHGIKHGKKQKSKTQCLNEILEMIKNLDWIEPQGIHIQVYKKEDGDKVHNYLLGEKSPQEKQKSQEFDVIYREKNNIEKSYGLNELSGIVDNK